MDLVRLNDSNYEETLKSTLAGIKDSSSFPPSLSSTLRDILACMPHKNEIISQFILDLNLRGENSQILSQILTGLFESPHPEVLLSSVIYAKKLGFNLNFDEVKVVPLKEEEGTPLSMSEVSKIKVLEYLEKIRAFVDPDCKDLGSLFVYFYCLAIIRNFKFSVSECVRELMDVAEDDVIFSSIAFLSEYESPPYLTSLLLRIISLSNYKQVLSVMGSMDKSFRDFFISMIHETYLIKKTTRDYEPLPFEDPEKIKGFIDEETVEVMLRYGNPSHLSKFLPEYREKFEMPPIKAIRRDEFTKAMSKGMSREKFFHDFCLLGSPSVSHFLSYLEIYKEEFRLSEEEQRLFMKIFSKIFVNRKSFSRIVLSKMVQFKILDKKFI